MSAAKTCSIARAIAIFGDKWTLLVIRQIFMRVRRFSEIQSSLGITKHRLADRLSRLVEDGVLYKEAYDKKGTRFEYKLSEMGLELYPVLLVISQWGDKWLADEDGVPVETFHKPCGQKVNVKVCCTSCNGEVTARNTYAKPGPGIVKKIARGEFSEHEIQRYAKFASAKDSPKDSM